MNLCIQALNFLFSKDEVDDSLLRVPLQELVGIDNIIHAVCKGLWLNIRREYFKFSSLTIFTWHQAYPHVSLREAKLTICSKLLRILAMGCEITQMDY